MTRETLGLTIRDTEAFTHTYNYSSETPVHPVKNDACALRSDRTWLGCRISAVGRSANGFASSHLLPTPHRVVDSLTGCEQRNA
eukprot:scaffold210080_cov42-Prasinocladus_malaysianus.AAC.3